MATLLLFAAPRLGRAVVYNLRAEATTITLPGGAKVGMWGFARDSAFGKHDGKVTIPGPLLSVPVGDTTLTVRLENRLTQARTGVPGGAITSILIPALPGALAPVFWSGGSYAGRVRSLTAETPPGNTAPVVYTWTGVRPGTYLYESGTQMQVQVQMGLYGALKHDAAPGLAYPGVAYDQEAVLVFSEIDPELHRAVVRGEYGYGKRVASTIDYHPRYFLVNGAPYVAGVTPALGMVRGRRTLMRMINAGLETHVPTLNGLYWNVVAEDANIYASGKLQYTALLPAGKALDALVTPGAAGKSAIYDHRLNLSNDGGSPGGMYVPIVVR